VQRNKTEPKTQPPPQNAKETPKSSLVFLLPGFSKCLGLKLGLGPLGWFVWVRSKHHALIQQNQRLFVLAMRICLLRSHRKSQNLS